MNLVRTVRVGATVGVWVVMFAGACRAEVWPSRPLRLINAGAPGTVTDIVARQLAERVGAQLGQAMVVDSRPSAGGIHALEALKLSPPDGYTLGLVQSAQMSVAPALFDHLPYDTVSDFAPVGILYHGPQVLAVNASLDVSSLAGLIELAKARPGRLRYSSTGNGSPTHIVMEQFKQLAGIDLQHIPYRGAAGHQAVVSGEVEVMMEGLAPLLPHILAGSLRPLAVTGVQRLAVLSDVPTLAELGIPGVEPVWVGVIALRGTPPAVIDRLNQEFVRAMSTPAVRDRYEGLGRIVSTGTPRQMTDVMAGEIPRWRELIKKTGIKPD
nr:tripartite tricarboxylate transporter substrate-binding protein [uncultured Roseateles sp.]